MLHLMANSSTSMLVTNVAWYTIFMIGRLATWMCDIEVAMLFLMLASVMMRAVWGDEELRRTMLSSSCARIWSFFSFSFLITKLKEKRSGKISMIQEPGKNFQSSSEKDGKIP